MTSTLCNTFTRQ